ncbi:MAG: sulfatase-like hydrolase/transferase [Pseudomonadales bacterium]
MALGLGGGHATATTAGRCRARTGRLQQTRMFDNTDFPWVDGMSTDLPTVGHLMREIGYYTAYKGKWHLTKEFETVNTLGTPTKLFTEKMQAYGFSDYFGIGDLIAHHQGGHLHDGDIAAMAGSWVRGKGRELAAERRPWFLAVNLKHPHDMMFCDTDAPGTRVQALECLTYVAPEPLAPQFVQQWQFDLPSHRLEVLRRNGLPASLLLDSDAWIERTTRCLTGRDRAGPQSLVNAAVSAILEGFPPPPDH